MQLCYFAIFLLIFEKLQLVDYSLLRPPMQFPPGMIPTSAGPIIVGGAAGVATTSKEEKEDPVPNTGAADEDDDNEDDGSET